MSLKKGDKVVMTNCGEAEHYAGKIWECGSDQFKNHKGRDPEDVVFLNGFSGSFVCRFLSKVEPECNFIFNQKELSTLLDALRLSIERAQRYKINCCEKIMLAEKLSEYIKSKEATLNQLIKIDDKLRLTHGHESYLRPYGAECIVTKVYEDKSFDIMFSDGHCLCMKPPTGPVMSSFGIPVGFELVKDNEDA